MKYNPNIRLIKPVLEGDKLHYQTDPYVEDGEVKISRIASIPIKIVDPFALAKWKTVV